MALTRDILHSLLRAHVWLLSILVVPLIKWLPLKHVLRLLTAPEWLHPYRSLSRDYIVQLVDHRLSCPRVMVHRPCLRRGLMLLHLLRLSGLPARLHFGLYPSSRPNERLQGHCWVTVNGSCAGEAPAASLAVLWTHPNTERIAAADSRLPLGVESRTSRI